MKMKNKKAEQLANRQKRRELLRANRRKEPLLQRSDPSKPERPNILIACDGENTEPSYFRQFRLSSATIKTIGEGYNTIRTVERAIELSQEKSYDQVWCVFDADPKPDNPKQLPNFNEAIKLAEKHNFGVAYSNQAFEYWIILHFNDHQGGKIPRSNYGKVINTHLKPFEVFYDYEGDKKITEEIFDLLEGFDEKTGKKRKKLAVKRAKRNYGLFDHTNPAKEESSTTVFRLVEELGKYV